MQKIHQYLVALCKEVLKIQEQLLVHLNFQTILQIQVLTQRMD
jgi:hypothetical protein